MSTPDPRHRFTDRASDYAAHRPSYPDACVRDLISGLGDPPSLTVADIGAGTGIMAALVAALGPRVIAVEPNDAMRDKARHHDRVEWLGGTAEATGMQPGSADLIVCAQAFHWFDPPSAFAEFRRVLKPGGRVALVWNEVDESTPMGAGYRGVLDRLATDQTPFRRYAAQVDPFAATDQFTGVRKSSHPFEQRHTLDGLLGRAASASYAPKEGPDHGRLVEGLTALHAEHADGSGVATLPYTTVVWTATTSA